MALVTLATAPAHATDEAIGMVTVVEGAATLLRGAEVFSAAQRSSIRKADAIETSVPGSAQLEFADGVIVALGPDSRIFVLDATPASGKSRTRLVLLRGWIKIDTGPKARGDGIQIASRVLSVATGRATLVFNVTPGSTQVFVESGSVTAVALEPPLSPVTVSDGQFAQRAANLPITVARALPAQFLSAMPRAFRDNLPPLATRFAGQDAPPGRLREASYADAADLLTLPRRWRAGLVRRFEGRTQDAAFRAALDANLLQHPEWDRVLHPEKYLPPPEPHADDETKKRLSATEGNSQ